ncbi:MAG: ribonuclease H [Arcanobacterium sp.]|nr:ribonuclease H [Arcanobacterium sp.]
MQIREVTQKVPAPLGRIKPGFAAVIATDGACSGNPGPGGWAWVDQKTGEFACGGARQTTNNIMELVAFKMALEYVGPEIDVLFRIDSSYVINSITKWAPGWRRRGWRKADGKPVLNQELIAEILDLYESRTGRTELEWVKGHSGDAANEFVDSQAVKQSQAQAEGRNEVLASSAAVTKMQYNISKQARLQGNQGLTPSLPANSDESRAESGITNQSGLSVPNQVEQGFLF